jgi:hypothetical protein
MSWRAITSATVPQLTSMNSAMGNANDHITIAEKQRPLEATTPGQGELRRSVLLDMAPNLDFRESGNCLRARGPGAKLRLLMHQSVKASNLSKWATAT